MPQSQGSLEVEEAGHDDNLILPRSRHKPQKAEYETQNADYRAENTPISASETVQHNPEAAYSSDMAATILRSGSGEEPDKLASSNGNTDTTGIERANGERKPSQTSGTVRFSGEITPNNRTVWIGRGNAPFFDGIYDEVVIWNVALKPDEILQAMTGLSAVNSSGKLAVTWGSMKDGLP